VPLAAEQKVLLDRQKRPVWNLPSCRSVGVKFVAMGLRELAVSNLDSVSAMRMNCDVLDVFEEPPLGVPASWNPSFRVSDA